VERHPDGFGVAWRENGELKDAKFGPKDRKAFRHYPKRIDQRNDIEYVAHFRWATHGPEDAAHAHPYEYTDPKEGRVLVFHNGVISIETTPAESDTEVFVRDVLAHLPSAWWRDPAITWMVGQVISWSRLVLMTATETVNLQEDQGEWDGGLWYSSNHRPGMTYTGKGWPEAGWESSSMDARYNGTGREVDIYSTGHRITGSAFGEVELDGAALLEAKLGYQRPNGRGTRHRDLEPAADLADANLPPISLIGRFQHAGHTLSALADFRFDVDGEYMDSVVCDTCATMGDTYVIDGTLYFDMTHRYGVEVEDDEGESMVITAPSVRVLAR